jgi:hypothetical protein
MQKYGSRPTYSRNIAQVDTIPTRQRDRQSHERNAAHAKHNDYDHEKFATKYSTRPSGFRVVGHGSEVMDVDGSVFFPITHHYILITPPT